MSFTPSRTRSRTHSRENQLRNIQDLKDKYNQLYSQKKTKELDKIRKDIYNYDETHLDGRLKKESFILNINTHGTYDISDKYKTDVPLFETIPTNTNHEILAKFKKKELPKLPVPVYIISGAPIGMSFYDLFKENVKGKTVYNYEEYRSIVDEFTYHSLLNSMNREKQLQDISHQLRELYLLAATIHIEKVKEYINYQKSIEKNIEPEVYTYLQRYQNIINHIHSSFNIHRFKEGETTEKFISEQVNRDENLGFFTVKSERDLLFPYEHYKKGDKRHFYKNGTEYFYFSLDDFINWHYNRSSIKPKYYIIVDFTCNPITKEGTNINKHATKKYIQSYKKHLNVAKRSFNRSKQKSRRSL